jgi:hypothetical protein
MRCPGFAAGVWLILGTVALAQQVPDPNFDAKAAKPAYMDRHPKVLFDEGHFNVHTSGGGYKTFCDLISSDGYVLRPAAKRFEAKVLEGVDILVIANARGAAMPSEKAAFTEEECAAVKQWVEGGGALLLITDHYPMGHAAAGLGKAFGVDMSKGAAIDAAHAAPGFGSPSVLLFSRENQLLADHAITRGRDKSEKIDKVVTFTGQSLKGPEGSVALLKLADSAVDRLTAENGKQVSAAGRCQGLAMKFGKGRVVVMGEAGQLSAQLVGPQRRPMGMNFPGCDNKQWALNVVHWLSGLMD